MKRILSPFWLGIISSGLLIWPVIDVIIHRCGWIDCMTASGRFMLYAFLVFLILIVIIQVIRTITSKR